MTTEQVENPYTHGTGTAKRPHDWRYLGRKAQAYRCAVCQLVISKAKLKAETDA